MEAIKKKMSALKEEREAAEQRAEEAEKKLKEGEKEKDEVSIKNAYHWLPLIVEARAVFAAVRCRAHGVRVNTLLRYLCVMCGRLKGRENMEGKE